MPSVEAAKLRRFPSSEAKERINVRAAGTSDGTKPCCLFPVGHNAVFTNTLELGSCDIQRSEAWKYRLGVRLGRD